MYEGHMDKTKEGRMEGEAGRGGEKGVEGGEWRQLYLNDNKNKEKNWKLLLIENLYY